MPATPRRRFVVGDVHGRYTALMQVLQRAGFDPALDLLISIGDLVDRGPQVREVLEYLERLVFFLWVRGNHDAWTGDWLGGFGMRFDWMQHGGRATYESLVGPFGEDRVHLAMARWKPFFDRAVNYLVLENRLFVHGNVVPGLPLEEHSPSDLMLSRGMAYRLLRELEQDNPPAEALTEYDRVFMGHSPCAWPDRDGPIRAREFWLIDQGAASPNGRLTVMDIDTEEWWQSDVVKDLPGHIAVPE